MEVTRRQVLASTAGVALSAGCIGSSSKPKLRLDAGVIHAGRDPFAFDVEVVQAEIRDSEPGKLAVTYQNIGSDVAVLGLGFNRPAPYTSDTRVPGIALLHPGKSTEQEKHGCWMPDDDSLGHTLGEPQYEMNPGEQVRADFEVWADPKGKPGNSCLLPDTYQVQLPESATVSVEIAEP